MMEMYPQSHLHILNLCRAMGGQFPVWSLDMAHFSTVLGDLEISMGLELEQRLLELVQGEHSNLVQLEALEARRAAMAGVAD